MFKQGHLRTQSHGHSCLPQSTSFLLTLFSLFQIPTNKNNNINVFIHSTRYYFLSLKTQPCFPLHATQSCLSLTKKTIILRHQNHVGQSPGFRNLAQHLLHKSRRVAGNRGDTTRDRSRVGGQAKYRLLEECG